MAACSTAGLLTHALADMDKAGGTAAAMQVMDNWEGQPGAAVLAKGATASRERRLLEWANDMEALVNTQVCVVLTVRCRRLQSNSAFSPSSCSLIIWSYRALLTGWTGSCATAASTSLSLQGRLCRMHAWCYWPVSCAGPQGRCAALHKTCPCQAILASCHWPLLNGGALQRNDLRRSRMELAAATEDAKQTRQELRVVRAELARSRAQQATVRCPRP